MAAQVLLVIFSATILAPRSVGQAQTSMRVRVLSASDGKPIKDAIVMLFDAKDRVPIGTTKSGETRYQHRQIAHAHTDANGIARFTLPDPAPTIVSVDYGAPRVLDECALHLSFSVADILTTGALGPNNTPRCTGSKLQTNEFKKPGELVLFGKRVSGWEAAKRSE